MSHRDRGRIKAATIKAFLGGVKSEVLSRDAERFAAKRFDALLRPDALATWTRHKSEGDQVIIVTASPSLVIAPFAQRLGADTLIGTRLRLNPQSRITGELGGLNCRGEEKVRRITEVFGPIRLKAAYGDTAGDIEMLAMADHPHMKLFKGRPDRI
jgi:phosphatidylglycerophosphatase C